MGTSMLLPDDTLLITARAGQARPAAGVTVSHLDDSPLVVMTLGSTFFSERNGSCVSRCSYGLTKEKTAETKELNSEPGPELRI